MYNSLANQSELFKKMDAPLSIAGDNHLFMGDVLLSISDLKDQNKKKLLSDERSRTNFKRIIESQGKQDPRLGKLGLQVSQ